MSSRGGVGRLVLCATPIGNLGDVTFRVIEVLKSADLVAAEDTRRTRRLFARYDIHTPLMSYREENREAAGRRIVGRLKSGETVALVSDAGTPGISDPGQHLVRLCIDGGIEVEVLPGPNAALTALVLSGLPTARFTFEGFLPRKRGARLALLRSLAGDERTLVFHEAPTRVRDALADIADVMGERRIAVARELTKRYEQVLRGTAVEVLEEMGDAPARGEFVVVVEGRKGPGEISIEDAVDEVLDLTGKGVPLKDAVGMVAAPGSGLKRGELYNLAVKRRV